MLPLSLIRACINKSILIELKNNETYNGHLAVCDSFMNLQLKKAICTSKDGDKFWSLPEVYIKGNTIKFMRIPDEVIDLVKEEVKTKTPYRAPAAAGQGRGTGRFNSNPPGRGGPRGRGTYVPRGGRTGPPARGGRTRGF